MSVILPGSYDPVTLGHLAVIKRAAELYDEVIVSYSNGLVIDYMREHGIDRIIKGYRNDIDLEYERAQAKWNLEMGGYETELWLSDEQTRNISSTLAREAIKEGSDTAAYLPSSVADYIKEKRRLEK